MSEILGPGKEEVWRKFAEEINGKYIEGHYGQPDHIEVTHNKWTIIFDTYAVSNPFSSRQENVGEFTIIKVPFYTRDSFQFSIREKGIINGMGKLFGAQDIEIGDAAFDKKYIIKGNDENKLQLLLSNKKILELIHFQKRICLELVDDEGFWGTKLSDGVFEITFVATNVIKNMEQLRSLYNLFIELLNQLSHIGSVVDKEVV